MLDLFFATTFLPHALMVARRPAFYYMRLYVGIAQSVRKKYRCCRWGCARQKLQLAMITCLARAQE